MVIDHPPISIINTGQRAAINKLALSATCGRLGAVMKNSAVGNYYVASRDIELYPDRINDIANTTEIGDVSAIGSWYGNYIIAAHRRRDAWYITLDNTNAKDSNSVIIPLNSGIDISFTPNGTKIDIIKVPQRLNDKVAWALGARPANECRSMAALEKQFNDLNKDHQTAVMYRYGKCAAVICYDGCDNIPDLVRSRYYIDGLLTEEEAVDILKRSLQKDGFYFSNPSKIWFALDLITGGGAI